MSVTKNEKGFPLQVFYAARQALRRHASGGNVLIVATVLAFIVANIPAVNGYYFDFWSLPVRVQVGDFNIFSHAGHPMTVLEFINDALMAVFFFTIGLEIKREILVGELSSFRQALLPIIAAIGGMLVPVAIFFLLAHDTGYIGGAAIPMATDIAFSLGILGLLGSRVPISLKIFLTTLAVVDDIGGIVVIAVFYSSHLDVLSLLGALSVLGVLLLGSVFRIQSKIFYVSVGGIVWFLFLNSGVHATIAGVLVAFCVPATPVFAPQRYIREIRSAISHFDASDEEVTGKRNVLTKERMDWLKRIESASDKVISPLQELEDSLHPLVNYFVIPLFAFANAGICLLDIAPASIFGGVSMAVICGLVIGKFLGIFMFAWLAVKMRIAPMPEASDWKMLASVAMLGGIGFTVSLFIANLSFAGMGQGGAELLGQAKLGIVVGSFLSGLLGIIMLYGSLPSSKNRDRK